MIFLDLKLTEFGGYFGEDDDVLGLRGRWGVYGVILGWFGVAPPPWAIFGDGGRLRLL